MNEEEKYTTLWNLPQGYGNNYDDPRMIEIVGVLTDAIDLHSGDSVLDVGGGDGRLRKFFPNCDYMSMDIAPNSGADIIADISEWRRVGGFEWCISIDVMEHLPTHLVEHALRNIAKSCYRGAAFLVCTRPDRGGKKIGEVLHMTVQPPVWWVGMMAQHWGSVKLLRDVPREYCLIVCEHALR